MSCLEQGMSSKDLACGIYKQHECRYCVVIHADLARSPAQSAQSAVAAVAVTRGS